MKEGAQTAEKLAGVQFELDERTLLSQQLQADLAAAQVGPLLVAMCSTACLAQNRLRCSAAEVPSAALSLALSAEGGGHACGGKLPWAARLHR